MRCICRSRSRIWTRIGSWTCRRIHGCTWSQEERKWSSTAPRCVPVQAWNVSAHAPSVCFSLFIPLSSISSFFFVTSETQPVSHYPGVYSRWNARRSSLPFLSVFCAAVDNGCVAYVLRTGFYTSQVKRSSETIWPPVYINEQMMIWVMWCDKMVWVLC